jgi:hypothetical protein
MESGTPVLTLPSLENLKFVCVMLLQAFEVIFHLVSVPYHFAYAMHLLPSCVLIRPHHPRINMKQVIENYILV